MAEQHGPRPDRWWRGRGGRRPDPLGADRWSRLTALVTAVTAVGALVFTAQSLRATRDQIGVTEQGQLTDRYTHAIDQLGTPGADHLWVRVGGIFALERVATDSARDQRTVVEVLSAFIRTTARRSGATTACPPAPADVAAAFAVLTRRNVAREHPSIVIDLRHTCLSGVRADRADLSGISLVGSDLHQADLPRAHGNLVGFDGVTLAGANLNGADLSGSFVFLTNVDLTGASLYGAKLGSELTNVKLVDADLSGARLRGSRLAGVDLTGARHDASTDVTGATADATTKGAWW